MKDKEIIQKYLKGDKGVIQLLYDRYYTYSLGVMKGFGFRLDEKQDIYQEVFNKFVLQLDSGSFDDINYKGWLITCIRNHSISLVRYKKNRLTVDLNDVSDSSSIVDEISLKEDIDDMMCRIYSMKPEEIFVISERLSGKKFHEINSEYTQSSLRGIYRRSIIKLRKSYPAK